MAQSDAGVSDACWVGLRLVCEPNSAYPQLVWASASLPLPPVSVVGAATSSSSSNEYEHCISMANDNNVLLIIHDSTMSHSTCHRDALIFSPVSLADLLLIVGDKPMFGSSH
jgi:hypothetical protein